jgi:hypothetical protein
MESSRKCLLCASIWQLDFSTAPSANASFDLLSDLLRDALSRSAVDADGSGIPVTSTDARWRTRPDRPDEIGNRVWGNSPWVQIPPSPPSSSG